MSIYLDNAATTAIDPDVLEAMMPFLAEHHGNPSSIHKHGRDVRSAVEKSRRTLADLLNTSPAEIFFTSSGTEADNMALRCAVESKAITRIITTKIEHHAVLHPVEHLAKESGIEVTLLTLDENGNINLDELQEHLKGDNRATLVSLMHANNEIGNLIDLKKIGELCREHGALLHSDTVQTMGHYVHDLQDLPIDFAVGSAHKFHGPKGIGFIHINHQSKIKPLLLGGSQERNMRAGTENVYGIVGLAKALEIAYRDMNEHTSYIQNLKNRMKSQLLENIPGVAFNGNIQEQDSLYTVLNVSLPPSDDNEMLLFNLDISGISCSGGSACTSGSDVGSHVLAELDRDPDRAGVRFSFSKFNTEKEIDQTVSVLKSLYD